MLSFLYCLLGWSILTELTLVIAIASPQWMSCGEKPHAKSYGLWTAGNVTENPGTKNHIYESARCSARRNARTYIFSRVLHYGRLATRRRALAAVRKRRYRRLRYPTQVRRRKKHVASNGYENAGPMPRQLI